MDSRDLAVFLTTIGVLGVVAAIGYAIDDLHERRVIGRDDLDRELEELIGGEK